MGIGMWWIFAAEGENGARERLLLVVELSMDYKGNGVV